MCGFLQERGATQSAKHSPYVGGDITVIGTGVFPFSEEHNICIMGKLS
jgi:hypothetical protein